MIRVMLYIQAGMQARVYISQVYPVRPARFATTVAGSAGLTGFGTCIW
jgi:hypothetical protein